MTGEDLRGSSDQPRPAFRPTLMARPPLWQRLLKSVFIVVAVLLLAVVALFWWEIYQYGMG